MSQKPIKELKKEHFEIQRAIKFLVDSCLDDNGKQKIKNPKPVVLHSIRVGMELYNREYHNNLVIAGILHDLIEDAEISENQLKKEFGLEIAKIVAALSSDPLILDYQERFENYLQRVIQAGRDAMVVVTADLYDNIPYLIYAENQEMHDMVLSKWKTEITRFGKLISNEPIYEDLVKKFTEIK